MHEDPLEGMYEEVDDSEQGESVWRSVLSDYRERDSVKLVVVVVKSDINIAYFTFQRIPVVINFHNHYVYSQTSHFTTTTSSFNTES